MCDVMNCVAVATAKPTAAHTLDSDVLAITFASTLLCLLKHATMWSAAVTSILACIAAVCLQLDTLTTLEATHIDDARDTSSHQHKNGCKHVRVVRVHGLTV